MPSTRPVMKTIATRVALAHGFQLEDLTGPARTKRVAHVRHEAMWEIYETGLFSYPQIGRFFGGRDHTTVICGCRAHEARSGVRHAA